MNTENTVAHRIACVLAARANCEKSGNTEWHARHSEALEALLHEYLPSGCGIDNGTGLDLDASIPEKLVFIVGFHHMDEHGGYDGWTYHRVIVRPSFVHGIALSISGPNRNDVKDYLADVYHVALNSEVQP
jgi:hypothetical protein